MDILFDAFYEISNQKVIIIDLKLKLKNEYNLITHYAIKSRIKREKQKLKNIQDDYNMRIIDDFVSKNKKDLSVLADHEKSLKLTTNIISHSGVDYAV